MRSDCHLGVTQGILYDLCNRADKAAVPAMSLLRERLSVIEIVGGRLLTLATVVRMRTGQGRTPLFATI